MDKKDYYKNNGRGYEIIQDWGNYEQDKKKVVRYDTVAHPTNNMNRYMDPNAKNNGWGDFFQQDIDNPKHNNGWGDFFPNN